MIRIEQQLADYAHACRRLLWQRQAMYTGGSVMVAYFVDPMLALMSFALCQICELNDLRVCRSVSQWAAGRCENPAEQLQRLMLSSNLTTLATAQYLVLIALAEGPSVHLGPVVFLLTAALYATMNACQVPKILRARLIIYACALLFIPVHDLIVVRPDLHSPLWLQLGVVIFVLFLLNECARKFVSNYRKVQTRLEDLRIERDRVAEAYEVQSQFVSIVNHELRTPLTSIKASLDLISDETVCPSLDKVREIARIGQRNGARLAGLIDDLLDFQKLDSGKMVFQFEPVDLSALLDEAVAATRPLGEARGISFVLSGASEPVWVRADADRLMQVLANVVSNAVKFSDRDGLIELDLSASHGEARVSVRDHGIGIPEHSEELVFAPFTQVDVSDKRAFGGTGLGMSISKRIVEGHGGHIAYTSRVGVGTKFVITLDLERPNQAEDDVIALTPQLADRPRAGSILARAEAV